MIFKYNNSANSLEEITTYLQSLSSPHSVVVRKPNRKKLESLKVQDIKEFTKDYSAPEINNADLEDEEEMVNICKSMSYSLGLIIKNLMLPFMKNEQIQKELTLLSEKLRAEFVQSIGNKFTIYRESKDKKKIEFPRKY